MNGLRIFLFLSLVGSIHAACSWPTVFRSTTWTDSHRGELTFTDTTMSGWDFTVDGTTVSDWECHTDLLDSQGYVIALATQTFVKISVNYYAYLCMKLTKITDYSYYYYESFAAQQNSNNERLYNTPSNTITDLNTICNETLGASGGEFRVLLKTGSESLAKQACPEPLLASFNYTHTAADSSTTCDNNAGVWDGCADRQMITYDYTKCPTKVAYTASGTSWCVASVQVGSTWFVSVYNNADATVDNSATYRFACFAVNSDGTQASVAPKSCRYGQTVNAFPVETTVVITTVTNTDIGATLTMSSYVTCPFVDNSSSGGSGDSGSTDAGGTTNVALIVGLVIGLLFAVVLIGVGLLLFKKYFLDTKSFSFFNREFSKSPTTKSTASSRAKVNGAITPAAMSSNVGDVVTMADADPDEEARIEGNYAKMGLEYENTILGDEHVTPVPSSAPPVQNMTPRFGSPLPQQILTPREPSALPLSPGPTTQI